MINYYKSWSWNRRGASDPQGFLFTEKWLLFVSQTCFEHSNLYESSLWSAAAKFNFKRYHWIAVLSYTNSNCTSTPAVFNFYVAIYKSLMVVSQVLMSPGHINFTVLSLLSAPAVCHWNE